MAALLKSKAFFSSNGKVFACQFSLNKDSSPCLNSVYLLVEVPPSLKAPRHTPSPQLNQLHREASKQQQQQKHPRKWWQRSWRISCGSETARAIRKCSGMGAEGAGYLSLFFVIFLLIFCLSKFKTLYRHPAGQLHGSCNCNLLMKYLCSMFCP